MSNFSIVLDEGRCINCHACEIHCQVWNATTPAIKPCRILYTVPRTTTPHEEMDNRPGQGRRIFMRMAFLHCMHCENPPCVSVCPSQAMRRRKRDGIVYVDQGLCVGCRACIMACPWQVPQWCAEREHVVKCDLCRQRLDNGLKPACVTGCTAQALTFSTDPSVAEAQRQRRQKALNLAAVRGEK